MDKKILISRVVPVMIVAAIILNLEQYCALSKGEEEVKKAIGVEQEWKGYHCNVGDGSPKNYPLSYNELQ